jgi:hypothetical protein
MDVESWWLSIGRGNNRAALEAASGLEELAEDREAYRVAPLWRPAKAERECGGGESREGSLWEGSGRALGGLRSAKGERRRPRKGERLLRARRGS